MTFSKFCFLPGYKNKRECPKIFLHTQMFSICIQDEDITFPKTFSLDQKKIYKYNETNEKMNIRVVHALKK
jgi:hypothetical protein